MPNTLIRSALRLLAVGLVILCCTGGRAAAATLQISGPPGALVTIGDREVGRLPLPSALALEPGLYHVACRAAGYHDLQEVVVLGEPDDRLHLHLRPLPLERRQAMTAGLFYAGLGQWYRGDRLRGWIYFLGETGGLLAALDGELQRQNHRDEYLNYKARYDEATYPEVESWRARAEQAYRDMQDMTERRNAGLYVAAGAWVLSLLDAWLFFPRVDIGPGLIPPSAGAATRPDGLHAGLALTF